MVDIEVTLDSLTPDSRQVDSCQGPHRIETSIDVDGGGGKMEGRQESENVDPPSSYLRTNRGSKEGRAAGVPSDQALKPGAFRTKGRASGTIPAWVRNSHERPYRLPQTGMIDDEDDESDLPPELRVATANTDSRSDASFSVHVLGDADVQRDITLVSEKHSNNKECSWPWAFALFGILALGIGLGLGFGLKESSTTSPSPQDHTFDKYKSKFLGLLDGGGYPGVFEDSSSPQYRALVWISSEDTQLAVDTKDERLLTRYALAVLYFGTQGKNWAQQFNFLDASRHECNWTDAQLPHNGGVLCNDLEQVKQLRLASNYLVGSLPMELDVLEHLHTLDVSHNRIEGSLPSWTRLTSLEVFDGMDNSITSTLPPSIFQLGNLSRLSLSQNSFSGPFPDLSEGPSSLEALLLNENKIQGPLPSSIARLTSLVSMSLASNRVSGALPSTLGNLTTLAELFLGQNSISGNFPWDSFRNQDRCALQYLDLSSNSMSGSIPWDVVTNWTSLQYLTLGSSGLVGGRLPSHALWNQIENLTALDLESTFLSGTIPESFGDLTSLAFLGMNFNSLSGGLPSNFSQLESLGWLRLEYNQLSGTFPGDVLASMQELETVDLSHNYFAGTLPSEIGLLTNLETLHLESNYLMGTIPTELGNLPKLDSLDLTGNHFNGTLEFLCLGRANISVFRADCYFDVDCSCCTLCQ